MEQKIQALERDTSSAEANAKEATRAGISEELKYWRTEKQQLRTEKQQLWTEKQQLREELARKKLEQQGKPACSPSGLCLRSTEACEE